MNPKLRLAGRAATVAASVAAEKARRYVARSQADVPVHALRATDDWYTAALCADVPGARVTSFHSPGGDSGTSTRTAIRVAYNDAGREAGLPTELFAKTLTTFSQRMLIGGAGAHDGETRFFMSMRPMVDIEAPLGYWGGYDDRSWRSMVLMEDVAATKGATFIEPATLVSRDQIEDLVVNLAKFHGALWENPVIRQLKTPTDHLANLAGAADFEARAAVGLQRAQREIPPSLHDQADALWRGAVISLEMATSACPRTLLHGDCHIGQTYVTASGRMGLADWVGVQQGGWGFDFAYLVGSACEPADRRAWERELLERYLEELAKAGGEAPSIEDAWLIYRQQLFYPYIAWTFTIGRAWYQPKMQSEETCRAIIRRLSQAIDDLDSLGALGL